MEKLKYLVGYLPFKVKYKLIVDLQSDDLRELTLKSLYYIGIYGGIKLALHPLSDLTGKELELAGFDSHIDYLTYENKGVEWTLKAPFNMVQYLLSEHFDIYGLIEQGLAIDINTLNK